MAERQPRHEANPSTAPDSEDAAGGPQTGEPLKTAAEVAASRLTEMEEGRAAAQSAGGDVPVRGRGSVMGELAGVMRRYPAAAVVIGLGVGFGMSLLVGRRRGKATPAAGT
jgi:hypothetical protein